jgi:ribose 1,5-bisphosphokinase
MGELFYVIGASGVGKDTLLNYVRQKINGNYPVIFAHRYITRAVDGSENYVSLSREEFLLRREAGFFALWWMSHGNLYGIGPEINIWMEKGYSVVVNGSREYLPEAQTLYHDIKVIVIEASPQSILQRLRERGREAEDEIRSRIERAKSILINTENVITINNDGAIEQAGEKLLGAILR